MKVAGRCSPPRFRGSPRAGRACIHTPRGSTRAGGGGSLPGGAASAQQQQPARGKEAEPLRDGQCRGEAESGAGGAASVGRGTKMAHGSVLATFMLVACLRSRHVRTWPGGAPGWLLCACLRHEALQAHAVRPDELRRVCEWSVRCPQWSIRCPQWSVRFPGRLGSHTGAACRAAALQGMRSMIGARHGAHLSPPPGPPQTGRARSSPGCAAATLQGGPG